MLCYDCDDSNMVYCSCCGDRYEEDDVTYVGDSPVCSNCLCENYTYCDCCNEYVPNDDSVYIDSEDCYVCTDCYERHYTRCVECDSAHQRCETYMVIDQDEDLVRVCEDCIDDYVEVRDRDYPIHNSLVHYCEYCGNAYADEDHATLCCEYEEVG